MESYDIANDKWYIEESLNEVKSNHSCCVCGDYIFVFGGFDNNDKIYDSIEK